MTKVSSTPTVVARLNIADRYTSVDAFSFFANPNQTAANDDDSEQPPASPSGSVASGSVASEAKPKPVAAPRKRKAELDENGQPKPKRKRRSRAEMCVPLTFHVLLTSKLIGFVVELGKSGEQKRQRERLGMKLNVSPKKPLSKRENRSKFVP